MAYVEGCPLSQRLKGNKFLPIGETVALVRKIALALAYAHQTGVVHRDLKPANIMIDSRGEPIVMDFGLARRSDEQGSRLTATGEVIGTIAYMPPEQLSGDLERIGPHSDVYSLGVILYETLTGQLPFDGPPAQMITKLLREDAKLMGDIQPHLQGSPLEKVVRKAMAKKVADRFGNMFEFEAALGHAIGDPKKVAAVTLSNEPRRTITMHGQPLDETPSPAPRRWQSDAKSARRKKSRAPAFLVLLAILAVAGGLLAWQFDLHRHLPDFGSLFAKTEIPKVDPPRIDDPKFIIPTVPVDPPKTAANTTPTFEKPAIESPIEPMPIPTIPIPVTPDPPVLPKPKPPETPVKPAKGDLERWRKYMDDARAKVEKRDLPGALGDLTVALGHAPDDARTARSLLERARVSLAFTAYGAARTDADQVGPLDPALGDEAALISAEANRQLWDFPASLEACDRIRSDSHRSVAIAHANRALVFILIEDWKEAANEIGFVFDSWTECPTGLLAAASISFFHDHDPETAIVLVNRGLAQAPNDPALLVLRAQVRTRLRLFDKAIEDCDEAAKRCLWLDPHVVRIQAKLARDRFGYTADKKTGLDADILAARKLGQPDTPAEWIHTATMFRLRNDLDAALACSLKALAQQPKAVPGLLARAGIQVERRDFPSVANDCRKVLDESPDNARALYLLGLAAYRKNDLDGALETYVRSEFSEPHFILPIIGRSDVHGRRKEFAKVIELCDHGLKIEPDQPSLYFNRAYAKNEIGDLAGAIRDYDKAIEFDNSNAKSFNNRGLVWARQKNFAKAADDFTESIRRNPKNEKTYKNRAAAFQQLGRFDEAAEDRRTADALVGKIDAPKSKGP
jgi:serine/threonine protein kinase/Flp pilus assembly protein TadD